MSNDLRAEADRLKAAASISTIIGETLAIKRTGRDWTGLCPFHAERTPSFTVFADHFYCFGCGAHGDVFTWLTKTRRMTFPEALRHLAGGVISDRPHEPLPAPKPAQPRRSATADVFLRLWHEGVDPTGTAVETYLRSRGGLSVPPRAPIRFHPKCQRGPRDLLDGPEYWPAMLALMTNPLTGQPVGLHRTYLLHDGTGKAPGITRINSSGDAIDLKSKRIMGTWGVVRLAHDEEIGRAISVAEGIENALTAMQGIGWGPCWACGTRDGIEKFPVLPWIEALTIFADSDAPGLSAAFDCSDRWEAAGREVTVRSPPDGCDWNDCFRDDAA